MLSGDNVINLSSLASQKKYDIQRQRLVSQLEHEIGQQRRRVTTKLSSPLSQTKYEIGRKRLVSRLEYDIGRQRQQAANNVMRVTSNPKNYFSLAATSLCSHQCDDIGWQRNQAAN